MTYKAAFTICPAKAISLFTTQIKWLNPACCSVIVARKSCIAWLLRHTLALRVTISVTKYPYGSAHKTFRSIFLNKINNHTNRSHSNNDSFIEIISSFFQMHKVLILLLNDALQPLPILANCRKALSGKLRTRFLHAGQLDAHLNQRIYAPPPPPPSLSAPLLSLHS